MTEKPLVIVTRRLPELVEARMMELFNTKLSSDDRPLDKKQLIEAVKVADILVPTVTDKIDSEIINKARAIFPLGPEKNPSKNMRTIIGSVQFFLFVMNGMKTSKKVFEKY